MRLSRSFLVVSVLAAAGIVALGAQVSDLIKPEKARAQTSQAAQAPRAVRVETTQAVAGTIAEIREAVGNARAFNSIPVTTKVSGVIETIEFSEGELVTEGEELVSLNRDEQIADKERAQAELRKAEAQRDELARRLERATQLQKTGSGAAAQVDDISAQLRAQEAAMASAAAAIRVAEARLRDLIIRAPFKGRVGSRNVSVGAYISPGTIITTLDDLSTIRIDFSVPENLLGRLQQGQVVRALSAAYPNREFVGKVSVIDTRVDSVARSVRLTADFDNPDEALKTGMYLSVRLEVANKQEAVLVPEESVVSDGLKHYLYVVGPQNVVERRGLIIGQRQRGYAEILSGVKAGETVIVRGIQRVRPGLVADPEPIDAQPAEQAAAAAGTK
ncbi:MAG: efflux RND transporter periplasmic adaptor subunit [Methylobacteriaceae bacterium]|jgi:membrane fusion protein (multidrug efflux system)|nr:efflux RND transporter periplasmic adaptor subunit [Methylobacteriaceae bacterium]